MERRDEPGRASAPARSQESETIRREEELTVGVEAREAGRLDVRKVVDHERTATMVPVDTEHAELEHHAVAEADSGEVEVFPDGSISIPVFHEELVIEKRLVVRERVIVRKHTVTEDRVVEADLRRERVEVEADAEIVDRVTLENEGSWGSVTGDDAGAQATTSQGGAP